MWHLAVDAPTRPECRCCIKINESPTAHPFAPRERNRGRRGQGWWERMRWSEKERGKKRKETEEELLNAMEDSGWWEVRYSVKGGCWAACCVLSLGTRCERLRRRLPWLEVRVLAPHLSFFFSLFLLFILWAHCCFWTNWYNEPTGIRGCGLFSCLCAHMREYVYLRS